MYSPLATALFAKRMCGIFPVEEIYPLKTRKIKLVN